MVFYVRFLAWHLNETFQLFQSHRNQFYIVQLVLLYSPAGNMPVISLAAAPNGAAFFMQIFNLLKVPRF